MFTSEDFLNYFFKGQRVLKNELAIYMEEMLENNLNIFLRARSGYGKTKLAHLIAKYVRIKKNEDYYYYLMDSEIRQLRIDRRIIILDEIHLVTNPEWLYPYLDSKKNSFILCTNEYYQTKEPLSRRCIELTFNTYSDAEIKEIVEEFYGEHNFPLRYKFYKIIANISRGRPSTALTISNRLLMILKSIGVPESSEQFFGILQEFLGIDSLGYNELDRRYIEFLQKSGRASLNTIALTLNIDKKVILEEIEPKLIEDSILRITSKGREI